MTPLKPLTPGKAIYVGGMPKKDVPDGAQVFIEADPQALEALGDDDVVAIRIKAAEGESMIDMSSGVSMLDGHPFIDLRWGDEAAQLTPQEVQSHALALLQTAAAAEADALTIRGLVRAGFDNQASLAIIAIMREERQIPWPTNDEAPEPK